MTRRMGKSEAQTLNDILMRANPAVNGAVLFGRFTEFTFLHKLYSGTSKTVVVL